MRSKATDMQVAENAIGKVLLFYPHGNEIPPSTVLVIIGDLRTCLCTNWEKVKGEVVPVLNESVKHHTVKTCGKVEV
jgi:hypothetical protein